MEKGIALFPDAPTARGRRHLKELARAVSQGVRGVMLFVVQRPDAFFFGPNPLDARFYRAFMEALGEGVEAYALVSSFDGESLRPVRFLGPDSLRYMRG